MEFFPNRAHVRLRTRVHGGYLHADEDGVGVSLSLQRASLSTAWKVQRLARDGAAYVLLYGAAYGRYLALWPQPAPQGHRPVQRIYDAPEQDDILWVVTRAGDEGDDVLIRHDRHDTLYFGVTVDNDDDQSLHWMVEAIPPRPEPPVFPPPMDPPELWRRIVYREADGHGFWNPHVRRFMFYGQSVFNLRGILATHLHQEVEDITLCVRGGSQGRMTPLVVDLPFDQLPMEIVVLVTGSRVALRLRHPDVDAL